MPPKHSQFQAFRRATDRRGMTLLEVLLVLGLLVIVSALLIPMLLGARERARAVMCQDQLRLIGTAFSVHADNDKLERFTTGAFDFIDDGCPDQFGWVSSLRTIEPQVSVLSETPATSLLLCPGNPLRGSRVLEDLLRADAARLPPVDVNGIARWKVGMCNAVDGILSTTPKTVERAASVQAMVRGGWNTNYAASWFLVRGEPALWLSQRTGINPGGQTLWQLSMKTDDVYVGCPGLSHLNCTTGPLTRRQIDNSDVPSSTLPFLGDGAPAVVDIRLSASMGYNLPRGSSLTMNFGVGPATWNPQTHAVERFTATTAVPARDLNPDRFPFPVGEIMTGGMAAKVTRNPSRTLVLQDTRHWAAVHRGQLQLLMGDGSVRQLTDRNGDGFINPGFPVERPVEERAKATGQRTDYRDGLVESNGFEVFAGTLICEPSFTQGTFEEF